MYVFVQCEIMVQSVQHFNTFSRKMLHKLIISMLLCCAVCVLVKYILCSMLSNSIAKSEL